MPRMSGVSWDESPVTVPPGRTRLCTSLAPTGSVTFTMTIGTVGAALCAASVAALPDATMTSIRQSGQLGGQVREALQPPFRPAILERDRASGNPAVLGQAGDERVGDVLGGGRRGGHQDADGGILAGGWPSRGDRQQSESEREGKRPHPERPAAARAADRSTCPDSARSRRGRPDRTPRPDRPDP